MDAACCDLLHWVGSEWGSSPIQNVLPAGNTFWCKSNLRIANLTHFILTRRQAHAEAPPPYYAASLFALAYNLRYKRGFVAHEFDHRIVLSPAVPFYTRVSAWIKPPLCRDSSVSVYSPRHRGVAEAPAREHHAQCETAAWDPTILSTRILG